MVIDETFIKNKINEYLFLIYKLGYVTDSKRLSIIKNNLNNLRIEIDSSLKADALVNGECIKVNPVMLNKYKDMFGKCFIDEALFHEFTHIANNIHQIAFDRNYPPAYKLIDNMYIKFNNENLNNFKRKIYNIYNIFIRENQNPLIYNQNPGNGLVLLDEVIAQITAQNLVEYKSSYTSNYVKNNYLDMYEEREYVIDNDFCYPPITTVTSMASYEELYAVAIAFLEKYNTDIMWLIKKSLNDDITSEVFKNMNTKDIKTLYEDLCILGIPFIREYYLLGHTYITNKYDPALDKKMVHNAIVRTLKK